MDSDTGIITYTAETGNVVQGIALGVMASVLDHKRVVLHLTPITTDIENLNDDGAGIKMTDIPVQVPQPCRLVSPQAKVTGNVDYG